MTATSVVEWADRALDGIEKRPGMYGPAISIEAQYILLLEARAVAKGTNPVLVLDSWHLILGDLEPLKSATEQLDENQLVERLKLLRAECHI